MKKNGVSLSAAIRAFIENGIAEPASGQCKMATLEDLDARVRVLESEVVGEKAVTRHVYEQSVRNGDQLGALRSEVATARVDIQALAARSDHVVQEVVQNTAALRNHGTLLTLLQQDVGALRTDATELRRGQEAINVRLDQLESDVATRFDRLESDVAARFDRLETDVAVRFDRLETDVAVRFDRLEPNVAARFDRLESNVVAILAAVTPPNPA